MAKAKLDIDPSLAFTALLEVPAFCKSRAADADRVITLFLADWYDAPETDMVAYARTWAAGYYGS